MRIRRNRNIPIFKFLYESGLFKNRLDYCNYTDTNLSYLTQTSKKNNWLFNKNKQLIKEIKTIIEECNTDVFKLIKKSDYDDIFRDITSEYLLMIINLLPKHGYENINTIIEEIKNPLLRVKLIEFVNLTKEYELLNGL
jgi:hypothetical protein